MSEEEAIKVLATRAASLPYAMSQLSKRTFALLMASKIFAMVTVVEDENWIAVLGHNNVQQKVDIPPTTDELAKATMREQFLAALITVSI